MLIRDLYLDQQALDEQKKLARPTGAKNDNFITKNLFAARKKYANESISYIKENVGEIPFSDFYRKNVLYGILDLDGDIVIPKNIELNMSFVDNRFFLHDFCVSALTEMRKYISNAVLCGKMSATSPYANFKIKKAYTNLNDIQRINLINLANNFKSLIINNKKFSAQITNIDIFTKKYIEFLTFQSLSLPFTKAQTALFYNFTFYFSGLSFTIAKDKASDDEIKFDKYLIDEDFSVFAELCMRYGFKIDKNIPWLISLDLNSPAHYGKNGNHVGYITKTGINNIEELFKKRYIKAYKQELAEIKNHFYEAYQIFLSNGNSYYRESDAKLCLKDVKNAPNIYVRDNVTKEEYLNKYTDKFWLRVYAYIRNQETKKGLTQQQFENIVREAAEYSVVGKTNEAMKYLNDYFKEYKELNFTDSLQNEEEMLQQIASNAGMPSIVF